jgi:K+-transporting ATPase ATPase A chain
LDSGPQSWKQYTVALLVFNTVLYAFGYLVLALQPRLPLNPSRVLKKGLILKIRL